MKHTAWIAIGLLVAGPAAAQEAYLCIVDAAAGMAFDKDRGSWVAATFKPGERYILRKVPAEEWKVGGQWVLSNFGETFPLAVCDKDASEAATIECSGLETLLFSKKTLRFQLYYQGLYVNPEPGHAEGGDTPSIEIGKCSPGSPS